MEHRALGACAWSLAGLLIACASEAEPGQESSDNVRHDGQSDAGTPNEPGGSASDNNAGGDDTTDGGRNELLPTARPAQACGGDLDADNGKVRPVLGSVAKARAFEGDPLESGAFKILTTKHTVDNPDPELNAIPLTIYAPSEDGKVVVSGKHPLVMVMPGYGKGLGLTRSGLHPSYAFYSEHLASHGFMVVGMNFIAGGIGLPFVTTENLGAHFLTQQQENVTEVRAVLDFVLTQSPVKNQVDESKIAIAGHSQGGKVAFFAAVADARFDLVIGWDPQNAAGGTPCAGAPATCNLLPIAPICPDPTDASKGNSGRLHELHAESLVFAARDSGMIPDTHQFAEHFYRGAPSPAHLILFKEASHENWSDANNAVAEITMRAQLALLLTRFQGMTGLDDYVPGAKTLVEGASGVEQYTK